MRIFQKIRERLLARYLGFGLRGKISFALIAIVSIVCGLAMVASYVSARHLILDYSHELLNSKAKLEQRELEIKLSGEIQSAAEFANNFITANALADTQERDLYLVPFLKNHGHAFADTGLTVVDYRGRSIASNLHKKPDYESNAAFNTMMKVGKAQIQIQKNILHAPALVVVLPVYYGLTNEVEGGVVLDIPLKSLLQKDAANHFHWLVDDKATVVAGQQPYFSDVLVSAGHKLKLPVSDFTLQYFLATDRDEVLSEIDNLLYQYSVIAIIAIALLLLFSRASARYISRPLEYLSEVAIEVTSSGRPQSRINIDSKDEYGALAEAFNTMFSRLEAVYEDLESRVKTRTSELEATRNLLHEAVSSVKHGFCIFDQQDHLIIFNDAYKEYTALGDFIKVGRTYREILDKVAEAKIFDVTEGAEAAWIQMRMAYHLRADAIPLELQRFDGRWFMAQEIKSASGYIVGTRIEITQLKDVTDALMQRELYLRATLDNLPFLFWLKDENNRFLAVNKSYSDACGLASPDDVAGKTDDDIWPKALAAKYAADDSEVMASMCEKHVEEPMDGSYGATWIETYKKPVVTCDGKVMGTVGFARDISDRKRIELALAEADLRWSMALRGANDGIWDWNLNSDKVFYSDRWKAMIGYAPDEISDSPDEWKSRIHPDDYERMLELAREHLEGKTEFYAGEHRLKCKDGAYKWILSRGKALFDDSGKPIRISGSHTDISEKKIAESIIVDRTQQLDAIFALSPDGFVSFDHNHVFKYANPAFYHLTGLHVAKLSGTTEDEFSHLLAMQCTDNARFAGISALRAKLAIVAGMHDATHSPEYREDIDGQVVELAGSGNRLLEVSLRLSKAPTVSEILYVRDVTYEVEVSRIKSEFLSTAAHELRMPMSSIFGYSELLLSRKFSDDQQRQMHEVIHKQAIMVSEILDELLDLQRIESRRGKDFEFKKLDVSQLINETVSMFKVPDGRTAPVVLVSADACFIRADRSKMIQVINNVLSNAYKYSPGGGDVIIEMIKNAESTDTDFVGIRIKDDGMGMKPEQLARVCERFYRADTSGALPGTGLGMSIVKEVIEFHNGQLEIASNYGIGTVVTLWLPVYTEVDV
jgi:PAS domain S-box-containing protein